MQRPNAWALRQEADAAWAETLAQRVQQARRQQAKRSRKRAQQAARADPPTPGQVSLSASVQTAACMVARPAESAGTEGQLILPRYPACLDADVHTDPCS